MLKPTKTLIAIICRMPWNVFPVFSCTSIPLLDGGKLNLLETLRGDPEALQEIATFDRNMAYPSTDAARVLH